MHGAELKCRECWDEFIFTLEARLEPICSTTSTTGKVQPPTLDSDRKAALYQLEGGSVRGRYAWILEDVEPISPFPVRGRQGLFDVELPSETPDFDHVYRVRKYMGDRYGLRCRVLAQGPGPGPHNMLLEFEDGFRFVSPKWSAIPEKDWKPKAQLELF